MANEVLEKLGTPVVWADTTDYSSTGSGYTRTAQINMESVANNAARQGDKADLGATRAAKYSVILGIETGTAPTAGNLIEIYFSWSFSATAATGNDGGASGADGAYKAGEEDEWKKQLDGPYIMVLTADGAGTVQRQTIGTLRALNRYVSPVMVNKSGQTLDTDAAQMYLALVPIPDEIQ